MSEPTSTLPLRLHLLSPAAKLPSVAPISATGGARAGVQLRAEGAELFAALPDRSLAELRWIVDRMIRGLTSLAPLGSAELATVETLSDDGVVSLGLDLHHRFGGRVELTARPGLEGRVRELGAREDEYRAWVNEDASLRTSLAIGRDVMALADAHEHVEAEVLEEAALAERGLRLLLAVGGASEASPARLALARYRPPGVSAPPRVLLGKGITFDTGGINVKPYESFVSTMKNDMAGAALAFALFRALVEGEHPEPLTLVIPTCENAIDAKAMRPGTIVESYRGLKVRIDHTDAEGRLILADALAYASDVEKPHHVLSFATLTTAALISYGPYATPVHFADPALEAALTRASEATGEDLHFFPERVWHLEANRDKEADLRNTARLPGDASRGAGSRNAAHFLKHFTDVPLCHFDIFSSTWNWAGEAPGAGYGATGAPLRTLMRALEELRSTSR
jgi:leucyl aminopeptidase